MGNSHGKLLSACGINQASPGAPMQRIKSLLAKSLGNLGIRGCNQVTLLSRVGEK
jgi:hypothetical protein